MKCRNELRPYSARPRSLEIGSSVLAARAKLPSATTTFGLRRRFKEQERLARLDFVRPGCGCRRAALDDVGDIDVFALEADGFDDLGQQLIRAPTNGSPLMSSSAPSLADKHQVGVDATPNIICLRPSVQLAANLGPDVACCRESAGQRNR